MTEIALADKFFDLVDRGVKVQTTRKGRRDYETGPATLVGENAARSITITKVDHCPFEDLTEEDAVKDGFANLNELFSALLEFYPDLTAQSEVTVVHFDLVALYSPQGRGTEPTGSDQPELTVTTETEDALAILDEQEREAIEHYRAYNVPASWFVGSRHPYGAPNTNATAREVIALGDDFCWSFLLIRDHITGRLDVASSEAQLSEFSTGIEA